MTGALADNSEMDVLGAKMLAARISAGVRVGQVIELLRDSTQRPHLKLGDVGLVRGFSEEGHLVVQWSAGFVEEIDPSVETYEQLPPSAPKFSLV